MKENIEDYTRDGIINLDEYFLNNPSQFTYPYFIEETFGQKLEGRIQKNLYMLNQKKKITI